MAKRLTESSNDASPLVPLTQKGKKIKKKIRGGGMGIWDFFFFFFWLTFPPPPKFGGVILIFSIPFAKTKLDRHCL